MYIKIAICLVFYSLLIGCAGVQTRKDKNQEIVSKTNKIISDYGNQEFTRYKLSECKSIKGKASLIVNAPRYSRIRIMNIREKYKTCIALKHGRYHIEVTKVGYEKYEKWININESKVIIVNLKKATPSFIWSEVDIPKEFYKYGYKEYLKNKVEVYGDKMWEKKAQQASWFKGKKYCANLSIGGFDDWKLPSLIDLRKRYKAGYREAKFYSRRNDACTFLSNEIHKSGRKKYVYGLHTCGRGKSLRAYEYWLDSNKTILRCAREMGMEYNDLTVEELSVLIFIENTHISTEKAHEIAFKIRYGKPIVKEIKYNMKKSEMEIFITSERNVLTKQIIISLRKKYNKYLKKMILSGGFDLQLKVNVEDSKYVVSKIINFSDPEKIVEGKIFKEAEWQKNKLRKFLSQYPHSIHAQAAKKQLEKISADKIKKEKDREIQIKAAAYDSIIGSKSLSGAKFINGRIWQDQPVNEKYNYIKYKAAEKYCDSLNLLGVDKWALPTKRDFEKLGKDQNKLDYRAKKKMHFTPYFTSNDGCFRNGVFPISSDNCVYGADIKMNRQPYISKTQKQYRSSVRCVLSPYFYNEHKRELASQSEKDGGFYGPLNAFKLSGEKRYIKEAYAKAKNRSDKKQIELALIENFELSEVFTVIGSLFGNENSSDLSRNVNGRWIDLLTSTGNAKISLNLRKNNKSKVPLKYGAYNVCLKVKLRLLYDMQAFGLGGSKVDVLERNACTMLSNANGYSNSLIVDFGTITQASQGKIIFNTSQRLREVTPEIKFVRLDSK